MLVMVWYCGMRGGWNVMMMEGGDGRERERASERDANAATRGEGEGEVMGRVLIVVMFVGEIVLLMMLSYSVWEGEEMKMYLSLMFDAGRLTGAALYGWLYLEEWFFV